MMLIWFFGTVMAIASLIFNSIPALIISLTLMLAGLLAESMK